MVKWTWKKMLGKIHCERQLQNETLKFDLSIYSGTNCLCVILYEFEDNGEKAYNFWTFFNDKKHLKGCLGLLKNHEEKYEDIFKEEFRSLTLNAKFNDSWTLAMIFSQAGYDIEMINLPF